ncbi:unnamed protein product [Absidia cylindrospora]
MATKSDAFMGTAHQRPFTCNVSPVVLFSVLDHYLRRKANQHKVVGALLGVRRNDGTEVEIETPLA